MSDEFEAFEEPAEEDSTANVGEQILAQLAEAVDLAIKRFARAANGESVFRDNADLRAMLALLGYVPLILEKYQVSKRATYDWSQHQIPLIPKCEFCGDGPGAHWTEDCPKNPDRVPRFVYPPVIAK
jgi:hypothetical protein